MTDDRVVRPGSTIGILGGGQLGRFLAMLAIDRGYRVRAYAPEKDAPIAAICEHVCAAFDNESALRAFAATVDVVTLEFENIPVRGLEVLAEGTRVFPSSSVLRITQNRRNEKEFLRALSMPTVRWFPVCEEKDLVLAAEGAAGAGILKTATMGYDGRGQVGFRDLATLRTAWEQLKQNECVAEAKIPLNDEISVLVARSERGEVAAYDPIRNRHRGGILDSSIWPAYVESAIAARAVAMACSIAEALGMVGLLCVEFFIDERRDLYVNEIAPRPHNSGHLTIEAAEVSQYDQQLRAICGLPLGSIERKTQAAMVNLLGDLWDHRTPDWSRVQSVPGAVLHLYGKSTPKRGRKMGHITLTGPDAREAEIQLLTLRDALVSH